MLNWEIRQFAIVYNSHDVGTAKGATVKPVCLFLAANHSLASEGGSSPCGLEESEGNHFVHLFGQEFGLVLEKVRFQWV